MFFKINGNYGTYTHLIGQAENSVINTYHSVINFYCILMSYFTPQFPSLQSPAHLMVFYTVEYEI